MLLLDCCWLQAIIEHWSVHSVASYLEIAHCKPNLKRLRGLQNVSMGPLEMQVSTEKIHDTPFFHC